MRTKVILFIIAVWLCHIPCYAQSIADRYLAKMTEDVKTIRKKKASKDILNKTVLNWSSAGQPKVTLMDEIKRDEDEYRGKDVFKFKMNQVVYHVHDRQNTKMVSKGDYFNSNEQNVHYSAIEKTVKRGKTVTYTISGHAGKQEFVVVSFNPKSQLKVTVNDEPAASLGDGVWVSRLGRVKGPITISITLDGKDSAQYESFVILNHNPQKP